MKNSSPRSLRFSPRESITFSPAESVTYSPKPKKSILKRRTRDLEYNDFTYGFVKDTDAEQIVNKYKKLFNESEKLKIKSLLRGKTKTVTSKAAIENRKIEIEQLRKKLNILDAEVTKYYMDLLQKYRGQYDTESNKMNKKYFDLLYAKKNEFEKIFLKESAEIMLAGGNVIL